MGGKAHHPYILTFEANLRNQIERGNQKMQIWNELQAPKLKVNYFFNGLIDLRNIYLYLPHNRLVFKSTKRTFFTFNNIKILNILT